jgi:hypothetical protein
MRLLYHDTALSVFLMLASRAKSINQNRVSSVGEGAYLATERGNRHAVGAGAAAAEG